MIFKGGGGLDVSQLKDNFVKMEGQPVVKITNVQNIFKVSNYLRFADTKLMYSRTLKTHHHNCF